MVSSLSEPPDFSDHKIILVGSQLIHDQNVISIGYFCEGQNQQFCILISKLFGSFISVDSNISVNSHFKTCQLGNIQTSNFSPLMKQCMVKTENTKETL